MCKFVTNSMFDTYSRKVYKKTPLRSLKDLNIFFFNKNHITLKYKCMSLGVGEGQTHRLELVDYGVKSRPSKQNRARSLDLDLDLTETRT